MNKAELIIAVSELSGVTKTDSLRVIDALGTVIKAQVSAGNDVKIVGLLSVEIVDKPARTGRNPSTGATIEIAAHKAVKIKPSKELREAAK